MDNSPVAKTLWLHIGMEKAGTTAIQAACRLNRERLMQDGILYPQTPGATSHIKLTLFASDEKSSLDLRRHVNLLSAEAYRQFRASFVNELRTEIAASRCHTVCLSNEHLSSRIHGPGDIDRLARALKSLAEVVMIIVYLRPQHESFVRQYGAMVNGGGISPMTPPDNDKNRQYNYEDMLSGWANSFGDANIRVRIFDRRRFVDGNLLKDFFATMGYQSSQKLKVPPDRNRSLDADALEFLRLFNKYVPMFAEETVNPERGDVGTALETISKGPKVYVPEATLRHIAKIFEASNARVAARFLGRSDGALFDNLAFDPAPPSQPLTVERAVELAAYLWRWKQNQFLKAQDRRS